MLRLILELWGKSLLKPWRNPMSRIRFISIPYLQYIHSPCWQSLTATAAWTTSSSSSVTSRDWTNKSAVCEHQTKTGRSEFIEQESEEGWRKIKEDVPVWHQSRSLVSTPQSDQSFAYMFQNNVYMSTLQWQRPLQDEVITPSSLKLTDICWVVRSYCTL